MFIMMMNIMFANSIFLSMNVIFYFKKSIKDKAKENKQAVLTYLQSMVLTCHIDSSYQHRRSLTISAPGLQV